MSRKRDITERLYRHLAKPSYTLDQAQVYWWCNIRDNGGLRLTHLGFNCFKKDLDLESYSVNINQQEITKKFILDLDKLLTCPYYIERDKIHLFGDREAVLALLHGSVSNYISSLKLS